jgi:jacalin-like lectin domain-containing protein
MACTTTSKYGNDAAVPYSDDLTQCCSLSQIKITSGNYINTIQCIWTGVTGNTINGIQHGSQTGPDVNTVELPSGQYLAGITITYGNYINQLTFYTSSGDQFGPYGTVKGPYSAEIKEAEPILGFFGSSGNYVNQLGAFVQAACPDR